MILIITGCKEENILANETLIDDDFNKLDLEKLNHYYIEAELNYENKTYKAKQNIVYVNNTDKILGELYFHIYPNAFKTLETAPILFSGASETSISYKGGYMDIKGIFTDNRQLKYKIKGEENTILHIKLDKPLMKGEKVDIYMEYEVVLPTTKDRFGYGDRVINCGNWYPIACVYDENGWNLDSYYKLGGDPFYSDVANYNVKINTDKDVIIGSSGNILSETIEGNGRTYEIEGKLIRDFAWVASKDFKIAESYVDRTRIKLYYLDKKKIL